jgi:hypothetical protein
MIHVNGLPLHINAIRSRHARRYTKRISLANIVPGCIMPLHSSSQRHHTVIKYSSPRENVTVLHRRSAEHDARD